MKVIKNDLSVREIEFLIKQEAVYLEKEIIEAENSNKHFKLAFISKTNWDIQTYHDTFSEEVLSEMISVRDDIRKMHTDGEGSISVRFFDTNVLSILFVECDDSWIADFCDKLRMTYVCSNPGSFEFEYIGDALYKAAYQMNGSYVGIERKVDVGLSYQQNYLVQVVSRDRNEPVETLLSEAVNQVIFKYHQVMKNE